MKIQFLCLVGVFLAGPHPAMGKSTPKSEPTPTSPLAETSHRNEDWYFHVGLGGGRFHYDSATQASVDTVTSNSASHRTRIILDVGFFWPLEGHHQILGVSIIGGADLLSQGNSTLTLTHTLTSLSAMHFFGTPIGDGIFVRGDLGFSRFSIESSLDYGYSGSNAHSKLGLGFALGGGYSFVVSPETRLPVGLYFQRSSASSYSSTDFTLRVSVLL